MPSSSKYKNKKKSRKKVPKKQRKSKKNKRKLTKAQFIVLTGFVIVSVFYLVSRWLEPYTIIDTSMVVMGDETFIFNNIKQEALDVVAESKDCKELVNNLEEYKHYVEDYAFKKLIVYFDYSIETPCFQRDPQYPVLVLFNMTLRSSNVRITDIFYGFWPPESAPPV